MEYNQRNPAVRRLMTEAKELSETEDAPEEFIAFPLEDNLFEWHFVIRGPEETEFEGGLYHGRICLPPEYPMKPPSIIFLTPNGRFEVGSKICLSITGHHPEYWQPAWGIRTVCMALLSFFPTSGNGALGSLDYTKDERKVYAKRSQNWKCEVCSQLKKKLPVPSQSPKKTSQIPPELQISFVYEKDKKKDSESNPGKENIQTNSTTSTTSTQQPSNSSSSSNSNSSSPQNTQNTQNTQNPSPSPSLSTNPNTQPNTNIRNRQTSVQSTNSNSNTNTNPNVTRVSTNTSANVNTNTNVRADQRKIAIDRIIFLVLGLIVYLLFKRVSEDDKN